MKTGLKWLLGIVGVLIALVVVQKIIKARDAEYVKVATEKAGNRTIIETVSANGNIYPEVEVKISPDISGEITELTVEEGDSVHKGQLLARIYADIYALQRDEAASRVSQSQATVDNSKAGMDALRANMQQAQQAYDRYKKLYDQKVISQAEFEQYETTLRGAKANYNAAQQNIKSLQAGVQTAQTGLTSANKNLGRTTLVAPMDGIITSLKIKRGERVAGNSFSIGTEMMTVANMSIMELRVDVPENDIVKVNIGDSADIEVDAYNNRTFKGIVSKIASSTKTSALASSSNQLTNYEVRIRIMPDSYKDLMDPAHPRKYPFRTGMNASAEIKTKRHEGILAVPIMAVNTRTKGTDDATGKEQKKPAKKDAETQDQAPTNNSNETDEVVFVVQKDGTVKKIVVKTGIQDMNFIEVTQGLKAGDEVVTAPYNIISQTLKTGQKVKVVDKESLFEKK